MAELPQRVGATMKARSGLVRQSLLLVLALACVARAAPSGAQTVPATDATCTGTNEPVPAETIVGEWSSDDGETVEISPKTPNDKTRFVLNGKHEWEGTYSDGKLTFSRTPTAGPTAYRVVEGTKEPL